MKKLERPSMQVKSVLQLMDEINAIIEPHANYQARYNAVINAIVEYFPINFLLCKSVEYDTKTDRYVGKFYRGNARTDTAKLTPAVARFLFTNHEARDPATGSPQVLQVYAAMNDSGEIDDVMLLRQ